MTIKRVAQKMHKRLKKKVPLLVTVFTRPATALVGHRTVSDPPSTGYR